MAVSASTRNPRQSFDELVSLIGSQALTQLQQFETETGVNVGNDLAGALGTDFTLALERMSLPVPGWIGVAEVQQPAAFDDSVRRVVDAYNRHNAASGPMLTLNQVVVNGREFHSLSMSGNLLTLEWTYDRGYLLFSTDRALIVRAISTRDSGLSLTRSAAFRQAVPDGNLHHSAYVWANVQGALADVASLFSSPALRDLASSRTPVLVTLDGEAEQIHAASRTRLTSLVLDALMTFGAAGPQGSQTTTQ